MPYAVSYLYNEQYDGVARAVDAWVAAFEDAGHWLHHDQFASFMDVIGRFLSEPVTA